MQICSEKIGPKGLVFGVDLEQIIPLAENALTILGDVMDPKTMERVVNSIPRKADVILSDMAPDVSGIWQIDHLKQIDMVSTIVENLPSLIREGGSSVLKVFEGEDTSKMRKRIQSSFSRVVISKPPASRGRSSEVFFVCLNYKST